jgi:ribosomal protein L3
MSFWTDATSWLSGATENIDWGKALSLGASYAMNKSGFSQGDPGQTGYQGEIPRYTMERAAVANTDDPNRRPGSSGQRYMSDRVFTPRR